MKNLLKNLLKNRWTTRTRPRRRTALLAVGALASGLLLISPQPASAANLVKKSVVGAGHAEKQQVQLMVKTLLPSADFKGADAADALAIAICHAHHRIVAALKVSA